VLKVAIDPGHGGQGRGTAIPGGPDEADYCLSFANRVQAELKRHGVPCIMLREYDQSITLHQRGELAEANRCGLTVSLHVNNGDRSLCGLSCFVWPGDDVGLSLAMRVVESAPWSLHGTAKPIVQIIDEPGHWTGSARAVLRPHTSRQIAACLIELGFAYTDTEALLDLGAQAHLAKIIADCIAQEVQRGRADDERADESGRAQKP
jgi:N-acetylmuramoyl-L-alanine amidase